MKYILFVLIWGQFAVVQEFDSKETCERAREDLKNSSAIKKVECYQK